MTETLRPASKGSPLSLLPSTRSCSPRTFTRLYLVKVYLHRVPSRIALRYEHRLLSRSSCPCRPRTLTTLTPNSCGTLR